MNNLCRKSFSLVANKGVSDHWKERVLPRYSLTLFKESSLLFVNLLVVFAPFLLVFILSKPLDLEIPAFLSSITGLAATTIIALIYGFARARYVKK